MSFTSKLRKAGVAVAATGAAFGLVLSGAAANADPTDAAYSLTISGSDTIEAAVQGIAEGYDNAFTLPAIPPFDHPTFQPSLGNWNAFPGGLITPKPNGQQLYRPAGSGDGVQALSASWNPNNDIYTKNGVQYDLQNGVNGANDGVREFDFARSSSRGSTDSDSSLPLTYIPFARDAVSVAFQTTGSSVNLTNLTTAQLKVAFGGGAAATAGGVTVSQTGAADPVATQGANTVTLHPALPQSSSGTRSFFLGAIGLTNTTVGNWVEGKTDAPVVADRIDENDASELNESAKLVPFSAAAWIAQKNGPAQNTFVGGSTANLRLLSINGASPFLSASASPLKPGTLFGLDTTNKATSKPAVGAGAFARDTYIVLPTQNYSSTTQGASYARALGQKTYTTGTAPNLVTHYVVEDFGFAQIDYSKQAARYGEYYNAFTN